MRRKFLIIAAIFTALLIALGVFLFFAGSFEAYPSAEQIEKGRIAYGTIIVLLVSIEAVVITRLIKK